MKRKELELAIQAAERRKAIRRGELPKPKRSRNADDPYRRALLAYHARTRQARKAQRTPAWADLEAIRRIYEAAQLMTELTGIEHHVDHELPLKGELVSGLHVPANLRIIPASDNLRKHNKVPEEMAAALEEPALVRNLRALKRREQREVLTEIALRIKALEDGRGGGT